MGIKSFRKALRRTKFVEVYHDHVSDNKENRTDEKQITFESVLETYSKDTRLTNVLKQTRSVFRNELPLGLPPERKVDHRIEV